MPPLVVDSSALAAWILPDEDGQFVGTYLAQADELIAPWLIWAELRNVLVMNERRGRIPPAELHNALTDVEDLGISLDASPDSDTVLSLARMHRLTVYDALYLELALRRGAVLMSLDRALTAAARTCGLTVLP